MDREALIRELMQQQNSGPDQFFRQRLDPNADYSGVQVMQPQDGMEQRGYLLPAARYEGGEVRPAVPGIAIDAGNALMGGWQNIEQALNQNPQDFNAASPELRQGYDQQMIEGATDLGVAAAGTGAGGMAAGAYPAGAIGQFGSGYGRDILKYLNPFRERSAASELSKALDKNLDAETRQLAKWIREGQIDPERAALLREAMLQKHANAKATLARRVSAESRPMTADELPDSLRPANATPTRAQPQQVPAQPVGGQQVAGQPQVPPQAGPGGVAGPAGGNPQIAPPNQRPVRQPSQGSQIGGTSKASNLGQAQKDRIKDLVYAVWEQKKAPGTITADDLRAVGLKLKASDEQINNYIADVLSLARSTGHKKGRDQVSALKSMREGGAKFSAPAAVAGGGAAMTDEERAALLDELLRGAS